MYFKHIKITNFRNYENISLDLHRGINIIYGKNAQGKTNLLESIYVLGLTKSHRDFIDHDLIRNGEKKACIEGNLKKDMFPTKMKISISQYDKKLEIDNNKINKNNSYISYANIIIFYPDDLELIKGSPTIRRRYLNTEISQLDSSYYILLNDFKKILKMRNDYLKKISNQEYFDKNYFDVLNQYYIDKAYLIFKMRKKFIDRMNEYCSNIFESLAQIQDFHLIYKSNFDQSLNEEEEIKKAFKQKLDHIFLTEKKLKMTLLGPHRDDFMFYTKETDLKKYGSQGQQRMAVIAVKLAEIELFKKYKNVTPILLLDDVFSELDKRKRNNLLKYIKKSIQTIITTTDLNTIHKRIIESAKLIEIENGKIKHIEEVKTNGRKK